MSWLITEPLLVKLVSVLAVAITKWTRSMGLCLCSASWVHRLLHTDVLRRFSHSHIHRHSHTVGGVAPSEFGDRNRNHSHTFTWTLQHRCGVHWLKRILQGSGISRFLLLTIRLPGGISAGWLIHPPAISCMYSFTVFSQMHNATSCVLTVNNTNKLYYNPLSTGQLAMMSLKPLQSRST